MYFICIVLQLELGIKTNKSIHKQTAWLRLGTDKIFGQGMHLSDFVTIQTCFAVKIWDFSATKTLHIHVNVFLHCFYLRSEVDP